MLYKTDRDDNNYLTVQDEVVEVLTKEQYKSRFSTSNTLTPSWESVMVEGIFPSKSTLNISGLAFENYIKGWHGADSAPPMENIFKTVFASFFTPTLI